jgi:hypothetical protein
LDRIFISCTVLVEPGVTKIQPNVLNSVAVFNLMLLWNKLIIIIGSEVRASYYFPWGLQGIWILTFCQAAL